MLHTRRTMLRLLIPTFPHETTPNQNLERVRQTRTDYHLWKAHILRQGQPENQGELWQALLRKTQRLPKGPKEIASNQTRKQAGLLEGKFQGSVLNIKQERVRQSNREDGHTPGQDMVQADVWKHTSNKAGSPQVTCCQWCALGNHCGQKTVQ